MCCFFSLSQGVCFFSGVGVDSERLKEKAKEEVRAKMEVKKRKIEKLQAQNDFDQKMQVKVLKAQQQAYQEWIQENPSMAQSIEAGALGVSPQAVLDNTITAGGATGSSATAATVQLVAATGALGQLDGSSAANPGVVRTEASAAEEQLVPAMPEALPGEFVPCPRCNQRRARWETMRNQKRVWFRCHCYLQICFGTPWQ